MITEHQIDILEKDCKTTDMGSKYYKPYIVQQLIEYIRDLQLKVNLTKNKSLDDFYSQFEGE